MFHSGDHPTLKLRTREGFEVTGTHNHPVLCLVDMVGVPLLLWKLLEEIKPGDRVLVNRTPRSVDHGVSDDERDTALLLGAFVAEGWVGETRAGFNNVDRDFFGRVLSAYDAVVGGSRYVYTRQIKSGSAITELDVQQLECLLDSPLAELQGKTSSAKAIPEIVWRSTPSFKRIFLQALFEGDGSSSLLPRNTIQVSYSTYSEQLAKDVQLLLLEFGVISRLCRYEKGEIKVVITNRRDARLFARRVGFFGRKQAKLERELAEDSGDEPRALTRPRSLPRRATSAPEVTHGGCGGTTSTASSGSSGPELRFSSGSNRTRYARLPSPSSLATTTTRK